MLGGYLMNFVQDPEVKICMKLIIDSYELKESKQRYTIKKVKQREQFMKIYNDFINNNGTIIVSNLERKFALNAAIKALYTDNAKKRIFSYNDPDVRLIEASNVLVECLLQYFAVKLSTSNSSVKFTPGAMITVVSTVMFKFMCTVSNAHSYLMDSHPENFNEIYSDHLYDFFAECVLDDNIGSVYDILLVFEYLFYNFQNKFPFEAYSAFFKDIEDQQYGKSLAIAGISMMLEIIKKTDYTKLFDCIYQMYNSNQAPTDFEYDGIVIDKKKSGRYFVHHIDDNIDDKSALTHVLNAKIIGDNAAIVYNSEKFKDEVYFWFYRKLAP